MSKNETISNAVLSEPSKHVPTYGIITAVGNDGITILKGRSGSSKGNSVFIPIHKISSYVKGGAHKRFPDAVYHEGTREVVISGVLGDVDKLGFRQVVTDNGKAYVKDATITAKEAEDMPSENSKKPKKDKGEKKSKKKKKKSKE